MSPTSKIIPLFSGAKASAATAAVARDDDTGTNVVSLPTSRAPGLAWRKRALSARSNAPQTIGIGAKVFPLIGLEGRAGKRRFTLPVRRAFQPGQWVGVSAAADPDNWMRGTVASCQNGELTLYVSAIKGGGIFTEWNIAEWIPMWLAPPSAKHAGFTPLAVRLFGTTDSDLAARCRALRLQADKWSGGSDGDGRPRFNGTFGALVKIYLADDDSPIRTVRPDTKRQYQAQAAALIEAIGPRKLETLGRKDFRKLYQRFRRPADAGGKERIATAHARMNMVRMVVKFSVGDVPECRRLYDILWKMTFEKAESRKPFLTAEMIDAFRPVARAEGYGSVALATALQFETALRQKDTIGEWTPNDGGKVNEPTQLATRHTYWDRGLVWERHVDAKLIVRKPTSKSGFKKTAIFDLQLCPMVIEELQFISHDRRTGPMIICEDTGQPWEAEEFRRTWRRIAAKAGLPAEGTNSHTRAGATTEASNAGADIEHIRQFMTHSRIDTTQIYNRDALAKSRAVARARIAFRKNPEGDSAG